MKATMMKRLAALALSASFVMGLTACGGGSDQPAEDTQQPADTAAAGDVSADPAVTLTYAEVNPETSLMGQTATFFKEKVEELSGGSVTVNVQYSGVLGAEGDVLEAMTGGAGTIDVARISTGTLTSYPDMTLTSLLSVPFAINSREHFWKFAASDLGTQVLEEPSESLGIHGMFFVEEGFRHFFFRDEVSGLSDLQNMKIRVSTDAAMTGMVEGLGANPTVVAFTELYSALSSGVCDAAEQPIANYQSNSFNEVAPYMLLDGHTLGAGEVVICNDSWDKLTENQQAALSEACKLTSEFNAGLSEENEETCKADLEAKGAKFIEVDKAEWQAACEDIINTLTSNCTDAYEELIAMA